MAKDLIHLDSRESKSLFEFARGLAIIDAHEHFKPEAWHIEQRIDFSFLFGYCIKYMAVAGLRYDVPFFELADLSPADKWRRMKPFWGDVRHTSYGKGVRLSAQALIGESDVTDRNFMTLTEVLAADNRPGLYERFCRRNRIERVIVSNGTRDVEPHPYSPDDLRCMDLIIGLGPPMDKAGLDYYGLKAGMKVRTVSGLLDALDAFLDRNGSDPAVIGWKCMASWLADACDERKADAAVRALARGRPLTTPQQMSLNRFFYEEAFRRLERRGMPVAVHCGVSGDWRDKDVKNFIPMFRQFPTVRFDLFHMSLPSYQDFAWAGRNFENVTLNFCWAHLVSQELFEHGVRACLDVVPLNKIIAFGGDFIFCPPAAVGGLVMAKESLSRVLGERVRAGQMDLAEARRILKLWFHDNPKRIYALRDQPAAVPRRGERKGL